MGGCGLSLKMASQLESQIATHLFNEGAFIILLDVPEGTEVGIDYKYWNVGPKFRGIKMVPPGLHFMYYRYNKNMYQYSLQIPFNALLCHLY